MTSCHKINLIIEECYCNHDLETTQNMSQDDIQNLTIFYIINK